MDSIVQVQGLVKSYGEVKAVKGIDFAVKQGSLFAFLGPNGAGKSTTIDMLCTLLRPDAGQVTVDGHVLGRDDDAIRRALGVVFQDNCLDALLTVEENMKLRGSFYGLRGQALQGICDDICDRIELKDFYKRRYGRLSGGQRRRADIARALVHTPKVLVLDEPTTGLDPQTRAMIWQTICSLQKQQGVTVFLTTHYMEEAAEADDVVIIDDGLIVAQGTPDALRQQYARDRLRLFGDRELLGAALQRRRLAFEVRGDGLQLSLASTLVALDILESCRDGLTRFEVVAGSMDDVFLSITGKEMRS